METQYKQHYCIELPNPEREDYAFFILSDNFKTKEAAIKWAMENLGADEEGKINIIGTILEPDHI